MAVRRRPLSRADGIPIDTTQLLVGIREPGAPRTLLFLGKGPVNTDSLGGLRLVSHDVTNGSGEVAERLNAGVVIVTDESRATRGHPVVDPILSRDPKLRAVIQRLVEAYQPESIYLFGSIARGDASMDSDYDLLIIVPDDASPERRRSRLAYERLRGTGTAVDALVCTHEWFHARTHLRASFPGTVLREGKLLHAA